MYKVPQTFATSQFSVDKRVIMLFKLILVACVVQSCLSMCDECRGYIRIKRAKYYSNPPPRFYRKPPLSYPVRGPFSYTPPPGYMEDGDKTPGPPGHSGPPGPPPPSYKVSKHKDGLGEEDFSNLIKYLSKQDLDRIVELASQRDRYTDRFKVPYEQDNTFRNEPDFDTSKIIPFGSDDEKPNLPYSRLENFNEVRPNNLEITHFSPGNNNVSPHLDSEESREKQQISNLDSYIHKELDKNWRGEEKGMIFTDSHTMQEERLPKPQNLREDDYDVSYTNNVPSVVRAPSYKLENFADLPLMNYEHSQLETVNSYSVPHYTVTAQRKPIAPQPSPVLSSPNLGSISLAQQQSDAHLKAVKIWTHKSSGTAYTLHDDGTLSLEKPLRPKRKF